MPSAPVTLIAGGQFRPPFGTKPYLADALAATGSEKPTVVLLGAAHGDADGWNEIRSFVGVRARERRAAVTGYGVPSGAGLRVHGKTVTALGKPVQVFRASRGEPAKALADLKP